MIRILMVLSLMILAGPVLADASATKAINDLRAAQGRKALVYSQRLEKVAQAHASEMARTGARSHTGANGSSVGDRVKRAGYKWCFVAENIAWGQRDLSGVMAGWAASNGHRKNMLNRKAREFALARAPGNIWVMVLARPC